MSIETISILSDNTDDGFGIIYDGEGVKPEGSRNGFKTKKPEKWIHLELTGKT